MGIIFRAIGLATILLAILAIPNHAFADSYNSFTATYTQHSNQWITDTLSQSFGWTAHWDGVTTQFTPTTTGTYEIYYSLNGGVWRTYSSDGCVNRIDWTSGDGSTTLCSVFGLEALQKPESGSVTLTQDDLKIKIVADNTDTISFSSSVLFTLTARDYLFPALQSVPTCSDTDFICKGGQLLQTLFIPKLSDINTDVSALRDTMETKVPFAYILGVLNLGSDLSATNGATLTSLDIPYSSASVSATYGVPQSITGNLPTFAIDYINVLKSAISFVIWVIFVVYLIVRFRHKIL